MKRIFIGPLLYWLLWVAVVAVLWTMGVNKMHTIEFHAYIAILGALSAGFVLTVVLTYRKGERITRDPFEDDGDGD